MASSNIGTNDSVSVKRNYETATKEHLFRSIKKFVLSKDKNIGYQAQVIVINEQLYMGLTKMWFDCINNTWKPSRKSVFIPKRAFETLQDILTHLSNLMSFPPNAYIPVGPTYTPSLGPIEESKEDSF